MINSWVAIKCQINTDYPILLNNRSYASYSEALKAVQLDVDETQDSWQRVGIYFFRTTTFYYHLIPLSEYRS